MKLFTGLAFASAAFAAYSDTCIGVDSANCDGTCSAQLETCAPAGGLTSSDLACCTAADADYVCGANLCGNLPSANFNQIACCADSAEPEVPGIPTDAPVEPTADPNVPTESSTIDPSQPTQPTDAASSTMSPTSGATGTTTETTTESGASSVVMASVLALLAVFYH
ncbi:Oidioi.mRNA.OKI2018_I69.XSR.g16436.t1.cds [Oikopleura dioica]|uniref:Oidioi.mRNA.OKI2018_I69.XSR.g16436.t1.cds n=1 Tax=Oikopleura dioica TaxID=34765 RepID=A0ABN7SG41_OIKDI|nr:Oidioi.mRNA.OKI2018_I69.XSR.g16436.t1.cds [Oikopleura dioica]